VLRTVAVRATASADAPTLDLRRLTCRTTVLVTPDGSEHVLFRDGARSLQLHVAGGGFLAGAPLLTYALSIRRDSKAQLSALRRLHDLHAFGHLRPLHYPPEPARRRLRQVLQALDGWLAFAPYCEIAIALFGRDRVEADWTDPRAFLLDRVRRAVHRGRALMTGAYRRFLR